MTNAEDIATPLINPGEWPARILKGKVQKVRKSEKMKYQHIQRIYKRPIFMKRGNHCCPICGEKLKKIVKDNNIQPPDNSTIKAQLRTAIWSHFHNELNINASSIPLDKEDAKNALITRVSNMMQEAIDNNQEFTIKNLENLTIEGTIGNKIFSLQRLFTVNCLTVGG